MPDATAPVFDAPLREAARRAIRAALAEDCGIDDDDAAPDYVAADITSSTLIPAQTMGRAEFLVKQEGVIAGLPVAEMVFEAVDPSCVFTARVSDGTLVRKKAIIAEVVGPFRSLLTAERTALNFLQRLSGVAGRTAHFVAAVAGSRAEILDTRKTTPGLRLLEKYAVRCGGGANHRIGLHDMVLIKDNHLVAFLDDPADALRAVQAAGVRLPVEVEVQSLDEYDDVLPLNPRMILLDNMSPELMTEAVRRRAALFGPVGGPLLEASGGITLETVAAVARTGVERISVGALTHSAPALDISLEISLA